MSSVVPPTGVKDARELATSSPFVPITLHPLVLLNVADDADRVRTINAKSPQTAQQQRVPFGIILGTSSGRETSAHSSVDFIATHDAATGAFTLDWELAQKRVELCRKTLSSYDVLGWYTVGVAVPPALATTVQAAFLEKKAALEQSNICPKPIVVLVDTQPDPEKRVVPVVVLETRVEQQQPSGKDSASTATSIASSSLHRVEFRFESEETERIGVQQSTDSGAGPGAATRPWVGSAADRFAGSVGALHRRIEVITNYLRAVQAGDGVIKTPDAELLRRIKQCATKLPRPEDATELRGLLGAGVQDALATTMVALMTKGTLGLAQLNEDTHTALEQEARYSKCS